MEDWVPALKLGQELGKAPKEALESVQSQGLKEGIAYAAVFCHCTALYTWVCPRKDTGLTVRKVWLATL